MLVWNLNTFAYVCAHILHVWVCVQFEQSVYVSLSVK